MSIQQTRVPRLFLQQFACLLLTLILLTSCQPIRRSESQRPMSSTSTAQPKTADQPRTYLALGDSYTIGEAVAIDERWPVQLVAQLQQQGINLSDPLIIARTGWTTDELMAGIATQQPKGPFDLVSLLIGVNNQYRHRDPVEYRQQFHELLQQAIAFAAGKPDHVLVLSIPDWGVTPFASGQDRQTIADEIDQFNQINLEETEQAGAHYVDITPISRQAIADRSLLADDQLHPSGKMYKAWVTLALPTVGEMVLMGDK